MDVIARWKIRRKKKEGKLEKKLNKIYGITILHIS